MSEAEHLKHTHHKRHPIQRYPVNSWQRLYSIILAPAATFIISFLCLGLFYKTRLNISNDTFYQLWIAISASLVRLIIAYILSVAIALPLSFLIYFNPIAEHLLLPVYDIIESIPVLAFFPIIILIFIKMNFLNGAAILIIFLSMVWNIVFSVVGGLASIPNDLKSAATVFKLRGFSYIKNFLFPAIIPQLITGSILAFAQGWNIIIVAEVLHTYIPNGQPSNDLMGIGSLLVNSSASGQNNIFLAAISLMIFTIAILNFFIWQKLLIYGEQFKFD